MYVCICNAITDDEVDRAIETGHHTSDAVYRACGVTPQCGTCKEHIDDIISEKIDQRTTALEMG